MATKTDIEIRVNVTNGNCNISTGRYPLNTPLHIELTPKKLYGITGTTVPKLAYRYIRTGIAGFNEPFTHDENSDTWVLDTNLEYYYAATDDMYCTVNYEYPKKYAEFKNNLVRCETSATDGLYPYEKITITITANENCEFHVTPKISYYAYDETKVPWEWRYWDFDFTRVSESEYTYTFTPNSDNNIYTISAEAVVKTDITDKYGLIAVYKPTKDILVNLSKVRFVSPVPKSIEYQGTPVIFYTTNEYIDTAKYALSLHKMYFNIETTIQENICLGPYNTEIECPVIGTDVITLDMGTIVINGRYSNIMDYKNTEIEIYLPFAGFVTLETSDFMDKAVSLKYEVNVINGESLAVISANSLVMKTVSCNTAFEVPYRLNDRETVETKLEVNSNYLLSEKPFIYVKSFNSAMPTANLPYNDTKFYSMFSNVHGYTQATEIDFEVVHGYITKTEIDEIITALENGVFLP